MAKHVYSTTVEVEVDVDIDTDDLSDDDLREVCKLRGIFNVGSNQENDDIVLMWQALRIGNNGRALMLAKKIAEDYVGLIV